MALCLARPLSMEAVVEAQQRGLWCMWSLYATREEKESARRERQLRRLRIEEQIVQRVPVCVVGAEAFESR